LDYKGTWDTEQFWIIRNFLNLNWVGSDVVFLAINELAEGRTKPCCKALDFLAAAI
jgi:hypothetical protein